MDRRSFLKTSLALPIGGALLAGCSSTGKVGSRQLQHFGIQLYTVRDRTAKDFEGTIRQVAALGYDELEFAGYGNLTPVQVRALLDELKVTSPSAHLGYNLLRDKLDETIAASKTIGHKYMIAPSIGQQERASVAALKQVAQVLNRAGEAARKEGMMVGYHNHAFEFEPVEGQLPYDVLLNETDPDLVAFEVDLFWMMKGGKDPLVYFDQHPGRFHLAHVKDMTAAGEMAPVGEGQTNFAQIFAQSKKAGLRHYVVEHDNPKDSMQSIATSIRTLKALKY